MMISIHIYILIFGISLSQASNVVYLENCTYSIDLYKQYLNILWSSNDSRTLHIQAVYSLPSNKSLIPGHIYTYSSRSVAVIPFFVQCLSAANLSSNVYIPFTQCSSTITNLLLKKNHESTRTNLHLKSILSMSDVPILYIGEYYLILSNCSFKSNSTIYKLKSNEIFSFRIDYESSVLNDCHSCNLRTSVCYERKCLCKPGTRAFKLYQDKQYCIDVSKNCSMDSQRCSYSKSIPNYPIHELIIILIVLISFVLVLFILFIWYLFYNAKQNVKEVYSKQSIFIVDKNEQQTPSTLSSIDSMKFNIDDEYPRIIGETNNGEILFILA